MPVIGLDIGGANLKASDGEQLSVSRPFPLWQRPGELRQALSQLLRLFPAPAALAVTMTGELADCFSTKTEGVHAILDAVETVAEGIETAVWQCGGEFCSVEQARELVPLVAAANWHALASWVARMVPHGTGLLIDVGSTTCDIIPLANGIPVSEGRTDRERLRARELVYTGVRRTPIAALVDALPVGGTACPVAAELFASTLDVYVLLGEIPENSEDRSTADGRPATREAAYTRLVRMLCSDRDELTLEDAVGMAEHCRSVQTAPLAEAITTVAGRLPSVPEKIILSGEGEFLSRRALASIDHRWGEVVSLAKILTPAHSQAACAFALARLYRDSR